MNIDWSRVKSPYLNLEPAATLRDQAVIYYNGLFRRYSTCLALHL